MSKEAMDEFNKIRDRILNPNRQSIELDCAPGNPRPGDLIGGVIEGLGLQEKEACSRCFGNWEWDYDEVPAERWNEIKPVLKERIELLYRKGLIRYGSW